MSDPTPVGMYIQIGSKKYTEFKDLKFTSSADPTGMSAEIGQFTASIKTRDDIAFGSTAILYGPQGGEFDIWANYWLTDVQRGGPEFVEVTAQSLLALLDRVTLPARMCSATPAGDVIQEAFKEAAQVPSSIHEQVRKVPLSGFLPEQTARERVQWASFVAGGYVRDSFFPYVAVLPLLDERPREVGLARTFWHPSAVYEDYVTDVQVTAYTYAQRTPSSTDKWVSADGETFYVQGAQKFTLSNPNVPKMAARKTVKVDGVTIINPSNASEVLTRLAKYHFERSKADVECVYERYDWPGTMFRVALDNGGKTLTGYAKDVTYSFGNAVKAKMTVYGADDVAGAKLAIVYKDAGGQTLGREEHTFPAGYQYSVQTRWPDVAGMDGHRRLYVPDNEYAEGTMGQGDTVSEQQCSLALDFDSSTGQLAIYAADKLSQTDATLKIS